MLLKSTTLPLISIHALLAESDYLRLYFKHPNVEFLSTLSLRRATQRQAYNYIAIAISIHALLAESDA